MVASKIEYDWEGLRKDLEKQVGENRLKSITVTFPDRDPPRVMSGVSPGIHPRMSGATDYYNSVKNRYYNHTPPEVSMGNYTGYSFNIKFKEDADPDIVFMFRLGWFDEGYEEKALKILQRFDPTWTIEEVASLGYTMNCSSSYFKVWTGPPVFNKESNTFTSYASCLSHIDRLEAANKLMMTLRSNVVLSHGQIYVRSIPDYSLQEKVVWYNSHLGIMELADGYKYKPVDTNVIPDYNHPAFYELGDKPNTFTPPSNYFELMELNIKNQHN